VFPEQSEVIGRSSSASSRLPSLVCGVERDLVWTPTHMVSTRHLQNLPYCATGFPIPEQYVDLSAGHRHLHCCSPMAPDLGSATFAALRSR